MDIAGWKTSLKNKMGTYIKAEIKKAEESPDCMESIQADSLLDVRDKMTVPNAVLLQPKVEVEEGEKQEVKAEYLTTESPALEQNDTEEEELRPLAAVYVKTEVESDEGTDEQDHLPVSLTGSEEWDAKMPLADYLLLRVKKEEAGAGLSNEKSEHAATKEMGDVQDARSSGRLSFACVHCSETFPYKNALEHDREHREDPQLLATNTCQRQISSQRALGGHSNVHIKEAEKKRKFSCETCGREFRRSDSLKRHVRTHTGEKPYVCDHCGKRFTQISGLDAHRRTHTGEQPYICSICNRRFAHKTTLTTHTRFHLNIKPYECKECGKMFGQVGHYTVHMRSHTGERPHRCSICSKAFARMQHLNNHMFTHNRDQNKMSECEVCGENFQSTYMNTHMRTHTGEKPYECRFCDATFAQRATRCKHEARHSDRMAVKCKECGKRISSKENLKLHMRLHTGEKPYECSHCDKTFAWPTQHKIHETTHTKEYLYNCAECGKGYNAKVNLVKHILSHGNLSSGGKCKLRTKHS